MASGSFSRVANQVIADGRAVLIAGDMNTSFKPGLAGKAVEDCILADFGCAKGPQPSMVSSAGDGYDDTLGGILEVARRPDEVEVVEPPFAAHVQ